MICLARSHCGQFYSHFNWSGLSIIQSHVRPTCEPVKSCVSHFSSGTGLLQENYLIAILKEKQDLPTNIDTNTKSEKSNSTSNITNPSVDTHPVFLHLTKHKSQLEKSIKQLVNKKIFSAAKFPLSKDHSKILLIKAVNDQSIILPTPVTAEEFGEFMWIDVSKNINNNRHKTQTLMRKHFTGTFPFIVVCSCCFLLFIISNIFVLF